MTHNNVVVMVWDESHDRAPAIHGAWQSWELAEAWAQAVMKRHPHLLAEPVITNGKLIRDVGKD